MRLHRLPVHITGFHQAKDGRPRLVSAKEFKAACHRVAHADRGSVETFDRSLSGRNFYSATLRFSADRTAVVCNAIHRYIAFVPGDGVGYRVGCMSFMAAPRLAERFEALTAFQSLDADWLTSELREPLLDDLAVVERKEVEYWKPEFIGEMVFNYWD